MPENPPQPEGVAIIGLAGRFPGARNTAELWKNLCAGVESIAHFSDEALRASGIDPAVIADPNYVRARAVLDDADKFDASFFGLTPRDAELTDPQHRVFLECAWHALEDAGLDPARYAGSVGVFAGSSLNTYLLDNIGSHRAVLGNFVAQFQADGYPLLIGSDKDYLATRLSYKLNLRGPSVTVQTACSTSLVAVVQAVNALLGGQCDTALAGGVSITFPQERGHIHQDGAIVSSDGHCRPFDAGADGTIFGSGCGVVVLKRLADALAERDHIYAVIKGAAINNDGAGKVSYVAPSVDGQAEVIALAHALAGVTADTIGYVETHGTGTPLGDPIEISALTQAFRATTDARGFCLLGAVKSNFGHLEAAAGVTGLIKTALALEHGVLPPTLHFQTANPQIDFANSPFRVVNERTEWKRTAIPRRAGVSAFGVGGTNAHLVLEEAPLARNAPSFRLDRSGGEKPGAYPADSHTRQLLTLSAKTRRALEDATTQLGKFLRNHPDLPLQDVAWTLQTGRPAFEFRRFVVASDAAEAGKSLIRRDRDRVFSTPATPQPGPGGTPDELTALGHRWIAGEDIDWAAQNPQSRPHKVPLPLYPFERRRHWIEPDRTTSAAPSEAVTPAPKVAAPADALSELKTDLSELSGLELSTATGDTTLLELGFDSLFLTQVAIALQKKCGVKLRFRQLIDELSTLGALAEYVGKGSAPPAPATALPLQTGEAMPSSTHGPFRPVQKEVPGGLTDAQRRWLAGLVASYTARTPASKAHTARHRRHFADPRAAAGFRDAWKEMVYPIVATRSSGAKLWDLDGNEYVDTTMGFGLALFGHQPDFVVRALDAQMRLGMEIGPASPLAGEVAQDLCELVGMERATFCNTGSEAVLGAIRVARTVTGRSKLALFANAYHGINDEVLVRPLRVNGEWRTVAIAPGIPHEAIANVLVLEYGNPQSLEILRAHADELAAVLVEPVQSRRPDLQPREFLHALRALTAEHGTALIFDEVITGFRCHPGGAQAHFGIRADLATYGKVLGGGLPIGAIAGRAEYMDAFDGGDWHYGDESYPAAGVTFFAGTFVRHPLALAAAKAVLEHLRERGPILQDDLAGRTAAMIHEIAPALEGTPFELPHFTSAFFIRANDSKFSGLLYALLRHRGIHIWEGRPCFLSTAHTAEDVQKIVTAFRESIAELSAGDFLHRTTGIHPSTAEDDSATPLPLTEPQREIWLATQLGPAASAAFNETCTLEFRGPFDEAAMRRAIDEVVRRHDALRATFLAEGRGQAIADPLTLEVPLRDLSAAPDRATQFTALRAAEGERTFDLTRGPMVAMQLVKLAPGHHALIFTAHHIACDGWSYDIVLRELGALYSGATLPPARQLRDYASWEHAQRITDGARAAEAFWVEQFSTIPTPLELPTDRPRPAHRTWAGAREEAVLPAEWLAAVARFGVQHRATPFSVLLAAFQVLLHRLSGAADIVVGIPAAGQNLAGGHDLVGHCANLLPLRRAIRPGESFTDFLAGTKGRLLDAFDHQEYTFGRLLQKLRLPRDPGRMPLVQVTFNLDPPLSDIRFAGLTHRIALNPRRHYQFDLGFNLVDEGAAGLRVECDYNPDLFDTATIRRWLSHFRTLVEGIVADSTRPLAQLPLLTSAERQQLLVDWNDTARQFPGDRTLDAIVAGHALQTPNALAIIEDGTRMTYADLDARANRVARELAARGVQAGDLVGLPAVRSRAFVASVLGILKAGAAYVPLSPDDPEERRAQLSAACRLVLALDDGPVIAEAPQSQGSATADGPAYVLYTSGSTGVPKGVIVPHRAITRLVCNSDYVTFRSDDIVAMSSNLCFDAATFEIWGALLNGGALVVTPPEVLLSPATLAAHLAQHHITTLFLTTSLFNQMAQQSPGMFAALRNLVFGGEAADAHQVRMVLERGKPGRLVNGYGPTETTTFAVCQIIESAPGPRVPIGRPIANTTAFILDPALQPVPIGVCGELYIGGPGVALGYHGAPDLTAERFLESELGRLYRTGDLARWLPDSSIDYLGRVDQQIKLRGFRVEPGEIEAALRKIPGVGESAVIPREATPGNLQLVAYITPNGKAPPPADELRRQIERVLPPWMVPGSFVVVDRLPLTPNGKLDVRALPDPGASAAPSAGFVAPENTLHAQLIEIWEELLGRHPIGIRDHFFELGGHSLLVARMLATIKERLGHRIGFAALFEEPTIAHLAARIFAAREESAVDGPMVVFQADAPERPFFFLHGDYIGGGFFSQTLAQQVGPERPFYAVHPHGLQGEPVPPTVEEMAGKHLAEIRRIQPHGPYLLGGYCNGAIIAFEIARRLKREGESVAALILLAADGSHARFAGLQAASDLLGGDEVAKRERYLRWLLRVNFFTGMHRKYGAAVRDWLGQPAGEQTRRLGNKLRRILQRIGIPAGLAPDPAAPAAPPRRAVSLAYMRAFAAYVPRSFDGEALLLWPEDEPMTTARGPAAGWEDICRKVELIKVPGEHHSSVSRHAHLVKIGGHIRERLSRAGAQSFEPPPP